jgi:hypothetical protein
MAWKYYDAGIGNVGSYQVSGIPYMTASNLATLEEVQISFPMVTKAITVAQSGSTGLVRVHFVSTGSMATTSRNYWEMNSNEDALTMNVKCKEIYISNGDAGNATGFQLFAELTRIDTQRMFALTGSGISE